MEKKYIDTNIILRYLIADETNPHLTKSAYQIFKDFDTKKITLVTNLLVIAETIYVLEKVYRFDKEYISRKLTLFLVSDNLIIADKKKIISALVIYEFKNVDFEDAYTYFDIFESGTIDIYTFDQKHFKRFDGINVI